MEAGFIHIYFVHPKEDGPGRRSLRGATSQITGRAALAGTAPFTLWFYHIAVKIN